MQSTFGLNILRAGEPVIFGYLPSLSMLDIESQDAVNFKTERKSVSIAGYFSKQMAELRMPKEADKLGIRFNGTVLNGFKSVQHARRDEDIRATAATRETYKSVGAYDPVLRAHCRLEP